MSKMQQPTPFDIVSFIKEHPIVKLSDYDNNKLIQK